MIKIVDKDANSAPSTHRSHAYEEIEIGSSSRESRNELEESTGEYDHLTPSRLEMKHAVVKKKRKDKKNDDEDVHSPIRRNESLPPMIFHSPLREPPAIDVTQSEDLSDEDCSPVPSPREGVVLRGKKSNDSDPFADLLTAPSNKSHLRWSQELNPLYDYIRGTKVKPSVGYDISRNADDTIVEEPSSPFEDQFMGSENASIGSEDQSSIGSGDHFEGLVFVPQSAPNTLQRHKKQLHNYEEVVIGAIGTLTEDQEGERSRSSSRSSRPHSEHYQSPPEHADVKSATLTVQKLKDDKLSSRSPRLNKRMLQRRSKTVRSADDSNAPQGRQKALRMTDTMKDFSYITREYRLFYVKLPNGQLVSEVVNINKPVSHVLEKLLDMLGISSCVGFSLYVEGSVLTTMKEATLEFGEVQTGKAQIEKSVSLMQLVDNSTMPDQGISPILLKPSISLRMQGITTSRILRLEEPDEGGPFLYPSEVFQGSQFHKHWLAVVQGNHPCTLDNAVKLAAMQYQAYFLERTAENSVIGFCRPTEFLPAEFAGVRGIEQKMYKEQEKIKSKSHSEIQQAYIDYCTSLDNCDTMFFPVREARRRLFQNTRLKPVLLGVNKSGIMRVCPKTKEVLDKWEYQVLKNWAYSKRTFVIAFNDKNYPVESNQAKWISELVDFYVDSIIHSSPPRQ